MVGVAFLKLSLSILTTQNPSCHSRALASIYEIHIRNLHYHRFCGLILFYLHSPLLLSSFPPLPASPLHSTHDILCLSLLLLLPSLLLGLRVFIIPKKDHNQEQIEDERVYFSLYFQVIVPY